ncbi:MAG TPA: hypothetical protein VGF99_14520 [Myxococcota bacterium]
MALRTGLLFVSFVVLVGACRPVVDEDEICGDGGGQGDRRCADRCEAIVAPYRQPVSPPAPIVDAQCRRVFDRIGCACFVATDGRPDDVDASAGIGASDVFVGSEGCGAFGRPGDCLHDPAAFPGCVVDTAGDDVCATVCADLDAARVDDADGRDDLVVADSACEGGCVCAIVVGDGCSRIFDAGTFDGTLPPSFTTAANWTVDAAGT